MLLKESALHQQVCDYLRLQYPDVLYRTDFAAGTKLTMGQAVRHKRLQGGKRAWPDLFIAEPRAGFHGLFIELKVTNVYKQNGALISNDHVREQADVLGELMNRGYRAYFAVGFDQARQVIDMYLS